MSESIFEICSPKSDILSGGYADSDYAARLDNARPERGKAEYSDPSRFFANTYPTRGLRELLDNVCRRLSGRGGSVSGIFRLDTSYGGGKTHGLIALCHAARGMHAVPNVGEFVDPSLLPEGDVGVAAYDGENADPTNGRLMGEGIRAYTPWGEIAYLLGGSRGYEIVQASDRERTAPGADTLREVFQNRPILIVLDELGEYLRKVSARPNGRDQLAAFLKALLSAVEDNPRGALIYSLAVRSDGKAVDAFSEENQFLARQMAEIESVSGRKYSILNPTRDEETAAVLRRRLFAEVDEARAGAVVDAYCALIGEHRDALSEAGRRATREDFLACYPFHPDVIDTLTGKTSTFADFQRVRGMLRILGRTIQALWEDRPKDATAIHLHHVDLGREAIRREFTTRLGQSAFDPALKNDIAGSKEKPSLAGEIDAKHFVGLPPYASYVARTVFVHTMAYHNELKGLGPDHLRYAMLGPSLDIAMIDEARAKFVAGSAYLDDKPGAPLRFQTDANLTQLIGREEARIDAGEVRSELSSRIREIFSGSTLETIPFPSAPYDIPDDVGGGAPRLAVMSHDALTVGQDISTVPELVRRCWEKKGFEGSNLRNLRNNVVFLIADETRVADMRRAMTRRLALRELKRPDRLAELAEHQQEKVRQEDGRAEQAVANAIQTCYRHIIYPTRNALEAGGPQLGHTVIDVQNASERPGSGQTQVVRHLQGIQKLRDASDLPDNPASIRDRTPLKKGEISTGRLRDEFRKDPSLPMLLSDEVLRKAILKGIDDGIFVYRSGDLLAGPGEPMPTIRIDEGSFVHTMDDAKGKGLWPRPKPQPEPTPEPASSGSAGGFGESGGDAPRPGGGATPVPPGGGGATPGESGEPTEEPGRVFSAEGVLKEALTIVFDKARSAKVGRLARVTVRVFEWTDAFRLVTISQQVPGARKTVALVGGFETQEGSEMEFEFRGAPSDAAAMKDYLEPQFRAAKDKTMNTSIAFEFEGGLELSEQDPQTFAERLTRYASAAAYVEAVAEAD